MRLLLAMLALFASFTMARVAYAQSTTHAQLDVDLRLHPIDQELDSINAESTAATALYVTGTIVALTGAGIMVGAAIAQSSWLFGSGSDDSQTIYAGLGIGVLGLAAIGVAIGLDVDSGSRRRARATRIAVQPALGGGMISVSGSF